ncbi:HAMP domain-containing protein [Tumebacillus sp. BK434]|uniref:sensor histidine kinase n=1 Tax=Tumebacillus sp. BK434 TaxID=2512169 RepID=UPI00104F273D|nr:ATP-binding protein [Tumebacillus sp. BK434]TCP55519.1 HAMP domain-containing protein [Tumebacillus sp. BK434]
MNIRYKVMLMQFAIFLAVLIPLTLLVDQQVRDLYMEHLIDELNEESDKLSQLPDDDRQHHLQSIIQSLSEVSIRDYLLLDADGQVVISTLSSLTTQDLLGREMVQNVLRGAVGNSRQAPSGQEELFYFTARPIHGTAGEIHGALLLFASMEPVHAAVDKFRVMITTLSAGALVLAGWLLYTMAGQMVAPLLKMKDVTRSLANRNYEARVVASGEDEVGQLAQSINELASRLQHHEEQQQEFLADVTHELRTPLSYIQGYSQVLAENWVQDEAERQKYLALIVRESQRLQRLVSELTDLSGAQGEGMKVVLIRTDFQKVVREAYAKLVPAAQEKGIELRIERGQQGALFVIGDPDRLEQVLFNLLTNAIQYTPQGGLVRVQYEADGDDLRVRVQDTGIGIPARDLPHVFDRFYRVDKSRNRANGGMGLGLSIVKGIIDRHGGQIWVGSEAGKGTSFFFTVPLASSRSSVE